MSIVHFIGGEKGGVGKSVFSRLLSQYFLDSSMPYAGFDADQSHNTLTRFYEDYTQPVNLDVFESTDKIMETALEKDCNLLVDLPAQSERFLDRWIEENGVIDLCDEMQVPFIYWYVVDDGVDSAKLLKQFIEKYGNDLHCVVIKNKGCGSNFAAVDRIIDSAIASGAKRLNHFVLPALHAETMRRIDQLSFSFWGAENIKDGKLPHLSLMERQRTRVWVKKSYAIFRSVYDDLSKTSAVEDTVAVQDQYQTQSQPEPI